MESHVLAAAWLPWGMMGAGLLLLAAVLWRASRRRAVARPAGDELMTEPMDEGPPQQPAPPGVDVSGGADRSDPPDDEDSGEEITLILEGGALRDEEPEPAIAPLARYAGAEFGIKHLSYDEDSHRLSFEIEALLRRAGWVLRGHGVSTRREPRPAGVIIQHPGEACPEAAEALARWLEAQGHRVSFERDPAAMAPTVLIGLRDP